MGITTFVTNCACMPSFNFRCVVEKKPLSPNHPSAGISSSRNFSYAREKWTKVTFVKKDVKCQNM